MSLTGGAQNTHTRLRPAAPNLFGHHCMDSDHPQEHNLLYIALTRSMESLTLLLNRRTKHIVSPFLPIELVHYSMEMWNESSAPPQPEA